MPEIVDDCALGTTGSSAQRRRAASGTTAGTGSSTSPRGSWLPSQRSRWRAQPPKLSRPVLTVFSLCRQKSVLMLGEQFEIDAVYGGEGERRDAAPNKVVWGALDELPSPKL